MAFPSPIHPLGCVYTYVFLYAVGVAVLMRPSAPVAFPVEHAARLALCSTVVTGAIVTGVSFAIASVHLLHLGLQTLLHTKPHAMWSMLAVCAIVVLTRVLVASQQTLTVHGITTGNSDVYVPLILVARLCSHVIGWNLFAFKCGATVRMRYSIRSAVWYINGSALVLSFAIDNAPLKYAMTAILMAGVLALTVLLIMVRHNAMLQADRLLPSAKIIAHVMIPIGAAIVWLVHIPQLMVYYELVPAAEYSVWSDAADAVFALVVALAISEVLWNAENAIVKKVEEEKALRMLAEVQYDTQNKFLRYLFHELRVPLNGIVLASEEMLETASLDATQHENLSIIGMGAMSMSKLLDDCLSLAKIEAGKLVLEYAPCSPRDLVSSVTALFHFRYKSLMYHTHISDNVPASISGDEGKLRQVLSNFTSNAIKFTPTSGSITFHVTTCSANEDPSAVVKTLRATTPLLQSQTHVAMARASSAASSRNSSRILASTTSKLRQGSKSSRKSSGNRQTTSTDPVQFLVFVVEDSGIGISMEDQAKLFQPFEQIRAGATQKGNGTGLGLSICKAIIEQMNGVIGCDSEEGAGSRFWFAIPALITPPTLTEPRAAFVDQFDPLPEGSMDTLISEGHREMLGDGRAHGNTKGNQQYTIEGDGGPDSLYSFDATSPLSTFSAAESTSARRLSHAVVVDDTDSNRNFADATVTPHWCHTGVGRCQWA
jgi:signal transduction histidine kinase